MKRTLSYATIYLATWLIAGCSQQTQDRAQQTANDAAATAESAAADARANARDAADSKVGSELKDAAKDTGEFAKDAAKSAADVIKDSAVDASRAVDAAAQTAQVKSALTGDSRVDASHIDVDTNGRAKTVYLRGRVPTAAQRTLAGKIAADKAEGWTVRNELTIG